MTPIRVFSILLPIAVGLGLTLALSLSFGAVSLTQTELWEALWHQGDAVNQTIIWQLRLPRVVAAVCVGSALGTSGALLQGMLRNPLATPFLLGISAGAGLVSVAMVTLGVAQSWIPLGAWLGAVLTTTLVYGLARSVNGISVERLILGGVAVSSLFGATDHIAVIIRR